MDEKWVWKHKAEDQKKSERIKTKKKKKTESMLLFAKLKQEKKLLTTTVSKENYQLAANNWAVNRMPSVERRVSQQMNYQMTHRQPQ